MNLRQIIFYTFVLVALFLVVTNPNGVVSFARALFAGYTGSVGVLQGRGVTIGSAGQTSVGGIVR